MNCIYLFATTKGCRILIMFYKRRPKCQKFCISRSHKHSCRGCFESRDTFWAYIIAKAFIFVVRDTIAWFLVILLRYPVPLMVFNWILTMFLNPKRAEKRCEKVKYQCIIEHYDEKYNRVQSIVTVICFKIGNVQSACSTSN